MHSKLHQADNWDATQLMCLCPTLQAGGEGLDRGPPARDLPAVLRQGRHAHLCRQHGGAVQMEQEGVGHGAGQLLLGLLLHAGVWRLHERPVRGDRSSSQETITRMTGIHITLS